MKKFLLVGAFCLLVAGVYVVFKERPASVPNVEPNPTTVEDKKGLVLENIKSSDKVSSPLKITGYVNGDGWNGFEGQVGTASLYDNVGNLLDIKPLMATSDWMTTTVQFAVSLVFTTTAPTGTLLFKNENPSGEPIRDKTFVLPVAF